MKCTDYLTLMNVILTGVSVFLTGLYAFLTYRILSANRNAVDTMRAQILASVRPYVYFDLVATGATIEGVLKNNGVSAAYDVNVLTKPVLSVYIRDTPQRSCLLSQPISFLAPNKELREFFGSFTELAKNNEAMLFSGEITYYDSNKNKFTESFSIDLKSLGDMPYIGRTTVAEQLKKLNDSVSDLAQALKKQITERQQQTR